MAPVANAERLAAGIPGAELHVVPDGGHAVPLEHPTASAQLLIEWVRRHATVARAPEPRPDRRAHHATFLPDRGGAAQRARRRPPRSRKGGRRCARWG